MLNVQVSNSYPEFYPEPLLHACPTEVPSERFIRAGIQAGIIEYLY